MRPNELRAIPGFEKWYTILYILRYFRIFSYHAGCQGYLMVTFWAVNGLIMVRSEI